MNVINNSMEKQIPVDKVFEIMDENNVYDYLKENFDILDASIFPQFTNHSVKHALNVALLAMVISCFFELSDDDKKVLVDASLLHDIGRVNDYYDYYHCIIGTVIAEDILLSQQFYHDSNNLGRIKALILGHGARVYDESIFFQSNVPINQRNILLLKILKDADILDRVRLTTQNIDSDEINLNVTKSLFGFADYINKNRIADSFIEGDVEYGVSRHIKGDK